MQRSQLDHIIVASAQLDEGVDWVEQRYYATDQIATAHIIRRFRDLDMPLEEIADVLSTDDLQARNQLITAHLDRPSLPASSRH